jgi:hypothetical protein
MLRFRNGQRGFSSLKCPDNCPGNSFTGSKVDRSCTQLCVSIAEIQNAHSNTSAPETCFSVSPKHVVPSHWNVFFLLAETCSSASLKHVLPSRWSVFFRLAETCSFVSLKRVLPSRWNAFFRLAETCSSVSLKRVLPSRWNVFFSLLAEVFPTGYLAVWSLSRLPPCIPSWGFRRCENRTKIYGWDPLATLGAVRSQLTSSCAGEQLGFD